MAYEILVNDLAVIEKVIKEEKFVVLYFYGNDCGMCDAIRGKLLQAWRNQEECYFLSISTVALPSVASRYLVLRPPVCVVYLAGQEVIRKSGIIDVEDLLYRVSHFYAMIFH